MAPLAGRGDAGGASEGGRHAQRPCGGEAGRRPEGGAGLEEHGMQPVPGHGGAPRGACEPRGGQRHGRAGTVRARDGGHGAPGAHPGLGDGLRVDPAAPGRPGKHLPGAPHGPPGQVADVGPLRPAPAHDEGADAVPLVHDGQGGVACLLGQRADVVRAAPRSPADPGLAPPAEPDGPVEGLPDTHAETQPVGSEPVFPPAPHGGSLLMGRLATVPVRATPALPCRTACRAAHPYRSLPLQGTIPRRRHPPGPLQGQGKRAVRGRSASGPGEGPSARLGKSRT
jgi:hypothetical protein